MEEAERAATRSDTRKLNQMLKSVSHRSTGVGEVLLERNGSVIPDQARGPCRWEEHFIEHFNHAASRTRRFHHWIPPQRKKYSCGVDPPSLEEVCTAVRQLRNNRSTGEDGIPAGVYKTCLDLLGPWLHRGITKVWLCEAVPNNWSEAVILFRLELTSMCSTSPMPTTS